MTYAVVGHAGRSRWERGFSRGCSPSFSCGVWPAPCRVRTKKLRSCGCFRANRGEQLPGSGATLLWYSLFSRRGYSAAGRRPFRAAEAGHRLRPHGLTPLPGFLSNLPAGFFSFICHSFEGRIGPLSRALPEVLRLLSAYDGAAELQRGLDILLTGLTTTLTPSGEARPR